MARQAEPRAAVDDRERYARSAGYIVPGRCRGGEVRCESGAVPQLRCPARGRVRSTVLRRDERQPSEEGRFGRPRPPGLLLRRRGRFCERTNDRLEAPALAASWRSRGAWRTAAGAL